MLTDFMKGVRMKLFFDSLREFIREWPLFVAVLVLSIGLFWGGILTLTVFSASVRTMYECIRV